MMVKADVRLVYDKLTNTYLATVPESQFDDGTVAAYKNDTATVRFTFLPILIMNGDFGYDYANGELSLLMPDDKDSQTEMNAKVKWRGQTTNVEGKHKRNYHIKFLDAEGNKQDRKFFGLRNDNSWLLDAAQVDFSRIRNRVAFELWEDFACQPYYADKEPKVRTSARGKFVEVVLNGEYRGIYSLMENIDRSQLKLKKYDSDMTIHGQLWKGKAFRYTNFWSYGDYDNTQEMWGSHETKYPELEDVSPTDYSVIYNATRFVCDATDEDFAMEVGDYFDIDVLVDYFVFEHALWAIDNCSGKNIFWACYDKQVNKKLTIVPWDLDATAGSYPDPNDPHSVLVSKDSVDTFFNYNIMYRLYFNPYTDFKERVNARWKELRQTHFDTEALKSRYNAYFDMLRKAGALDRETERWSGDSDLCGNKLDFDAEQKYINEWFETHMDLFDKKVFTDVDGIENVTINRPADNRIYDITGRRMPEGKPLPRGLYIKNGKKYRPTPALP